MQSKKTLWINNEETLPWICKKARPRCYLSTGLTLIEVIIGVFVFLTVALAIYEGYMAVLKVITLSRDKTEAMLLANEQMEIIRNIPYADVGILGGLPAGKITGTSTVVRGGTSFMVTVSVRNVDDPFDGVIGGTPNDTSAADYKVVSLDVACATCKNFSTVRVTSTIAPKSLETASGNGALFVRVFDSNGVAVPQASVHIVNNLATTTITVNETTNNAGLFQLIDAPPGNFAYQITVGKTGYTSGRTYDPDDLNLPNPFTPHSTVLAGQVTQVSFTIDELAEMNIVTANKSCAPIPGATVHYLGTKLLSTDPDVYKHEGDVTTDVAGLAQVTGLEWDTYSFSLATTSDYSLAGTLPMLPVAVNAGSAQDITLVLEPNQPNSLLVTVKDSSSGLPLSGAVVNLTGTASSSQTTNRGFLLQTDWSAGPGQDIFSSPGRFLSEDGGIDYAGTPGELKLRSSLGHYDLAGFLISSTFDSGTATTTYYNINWTPLDQATSTGADSVKFQLASANELDPAGGWSFTGPDGTAGTYYTKDNTNIASNINNKRYIKYKVFLSTEDDLYSPNVSDISITYSTDCMPFGQAFFNELPAGTYTVGVVKDGYQTWTGTADILGNWQQVEASMNSN